MQRFKVRRYEMGKWDGVEPRDIEAENEKEAAEAVCGESLTEEGAKLGLLCAEVWLPSSPGKKKQFYVLAIR